MPYLRIFDALSFLFFFILLPVFLFWALSLDVTWSSLKFIYLRCGMVGILYFALREAYNGYKPSALIHKIGNHYDLSEARRQSLSKNVFRGAFEKPGILVKIKARGKIKPQHIGYM